MWTIKTILIVIIFFPLLGLGQSDASQDSVLHEIKFSPYYLSKVGGTEDTGVSGRNFISRRSDYYEIAYERIVGGQKGVGLSLGWINGKYKTNANFRFYPKNKASRIFVDVTMMLSGETTRGGDFDNANVFDIFSLVGIGHKFLTKSERYTAEIYLAIGPRLIKLGEESSSSTGDFGGDFNIRIGRRFSTAKKKKK